MVHGITIKILISQDVVYLQCIPMMQLATLLGTPLSIIALIRSATGTSMILTDNFRQ